MVNKKKKYTKDHVARKLGIEGYMIVAWEKEFNITPLIKNGAPLYTHKDFSTLRSIKELLYEKGFSLDAAKKYLQDNVDLEGTTLKAASPLLFNQRKEAKGVQSAKQDLAQKLLAIKGRLVKLRQSL